MLRDANLIRGRSPLRSCVVVAMVIVTASLLTGCSGTGTVETFPLMRTDLGPDDPLSVTIPLHEARYWVDGNKVNIALAYEARSVLGRPFETTWHMSIVLDELPAGSQKLYHIMSREVRLAQSQGGDHRRARSGSGVVVLEAPSNSRLKGQFHVWVREQRFNALTGWSPSVARTPVHVIVGRFNAVENEARTTEIVALTEADGFDRAAPVTSRPAQPPIRWLRNPPPQPVSP